MTRKKFLKLLMSRGVQRNRAAKVAEHCQKNNISYKDCWYSIVTKSLEESVVSLARAVRACAECMSNLKDAFCKIGR
jgi:predicted HTH domain antitoxin